MNMSEKEIRDKRKGKLVFLVRPDEMTVDEMADSLVEMIQDAKSKDKKQKGSN